MLVQGYLLSWSPPRALSVRSDLPANMSQAPPHPPHCLAPRKPSLLCARSVWSSCIFSEMETAGLSRAASAVSPCSLPPYSLQDFLHRTPRRQLPSHQRLPPPPLQTSHHLLRLSPLPIALWPLGSRQLPVPTAIPPSAALSLALLPFL